VFANSHDRATGRHCAIVCTAWAQGRASRPFATVGACRQSVLRKVGGLKADGDDGGAIAEASGAFRHASPPGIGTPLAVDFF